MDAWTIGLLGILLAWLLDRALGDPPWLPHLVVGFGRLIGALERKLNRGAHRVAKGACMALALVVGSYVATLALMVGLARLGHGAEFLGVVVLTFYCLAGRTLELEVRAVFSALAAGLDQGRKQVARIVGRDTAELDAQQVQIAALETLAENLSDGLVAPLFWLALAGVPGMVTYKMVNTLDSMVGYRDARYWQFGRWSARIDDLFNYIPARLTALLMLLLAGKLGLLRKVFREGRNHLSPNAGYPEAALALILGCQFGGPHVYHGELVEKPYIGTNPRPVSGRDMHYALRLNQGVGLVMAVLTCLAYAFVRWGLEAF